MEKWNDPELAKSFRKMATFTREVHLVNKYKKRGRINKNWAWNFFLFGIFITLVLGLFTEALARTWCFEESCFGWIIERCPGSD